MTLGVYHIDPVEDSRRETRAWLAAHGYTSWPPHIGPTNEQCLDGHGAGRLTIEPAFSSPIKQIPAITDEQKTIHWTMKVDDTKTLDAWLVWLRAMNRRKQHHKVRLRWRIAAANSRRISE